MRSHPGVRQAAQLTLGERAADRLRNGMGSWSFVVTALVFLAGWMIGNGGDGFDPYPFILLNLILSCLAAMQGAILLIAARRADQISAELAAHRLRRGHRQRRADRRGPGAGPIHPAARGRTRSTADDFAPATQRVRQALGDPGAVPATAG